MGYKHRTKSGKTLTFKNKTAFDRWQKGMFAGMNASRSSPKRFKTGKGRVKVRFQDRDTGAESTRTVKLKKQTLRGKKQDRRMDSRKLRLSTPLGSEHVGDSAYEIDRQFEHADRQQDLREHLKEKKPRKKLKQVRVVQISAEQKAENIKRAQQKEKHKGKQDQLDLQFIRAGITEKQIQESQMDRAQIKRLLKRATDNGAEAGDVTDLIDFESPFEDNVRANPIFVKNLEEKSAQSRDLSEADRGWAENHFVQKANDSNQPEKYKEDARKETEPVRTQITKAWVKNPTSKKGGDIDGVDDGSRHINLKKFDEAFNQEDRDILRIFKESNREESFQQTTQRIHSDIKQIPYPQQQKQKTQEFERFLIKINREDPGKAQRQRDEQKAIQRVREVTKRQAERKKRRDARRKTR